MQGFGPKSSAMELNPLGFPAQFGHITLFKVKGIHVQTDNKFFDDLAKLGQSAVGTLHGVKGEVEAMIRARMEHVLQDMDLVTREEFDVVRDMAKAARAENSELTQKITALEKALKANTTKSSST